MNSRRFAGRTYLGFLGQTSRSWRKEAGKSLLAKARKAPQCHPLMKTTVVLLVALSLGFGVGLLLQHTIGRQHLRVVKAESQRHANACKAAEFKLDEAGKVMAALETDLGLRSHQLFDASNKISQTSEELTKAQAELAKAQIDIVVAQTQMKKQETRIAELEGQKDDLTKRMEDLTTSISALETQISDTHRKLASTEGNRDFLTKELIRLQDEKAALVAQFNNLSALRAQMAKLKEEAAINQRLAWMQMGLYAGRERKGAERLFSSVAASTAKPDNRLRIELERTSRAPSDLNSTSLTK
jgi:peptidoglycan hydrolase CwlO-like protein